jgi:adenine-specific DNA methylase
MSSAGNNTCPRLIEVALPIREISAESVRDKSLRHGHISTLHLWWARRPLAASRAVVFASLVPDPDDPRCPEVFKQAVERHLKTHVPAELKHYRRGRENRQDEDPYRPYEGVPDTLRNRLLMFIAKWSPESRAFESGKRKKAPAPKELLDDRSLVKWETSDPENPQRRKVLEIARKLVWAAHGLSDEEIERLSERGIERLAEGQNQTTQSLNESISRLPVVLDPFAGGGAIPLEAGRLGCQPIANDYNPVAYLILRATCEFPQKYGRIERLSEREIERFKKEIGRVSERKGGSLFDQQSLNESISQSFNPLVHDVEKWANWILEWAREKIGHLYPPGKHGRPVVGYLWARTAPCSNPSCRGEIPLLRSLLVCNKKDKKIALTMEVDKAGKTIRFGIAKGKEIQRTQGTKRERGAAICPFCEQPTSEADLRAAGQAGKMGERMVAVIVEGQDGKDYRLVEETDLAAFRQAAKIEVERPGEPIEEGQWNIKTWLYGMKTWGSLFNPRQVVAMQTLVECLHEALEEMRAEFTDEEYRKAVGVYLGLWVSRIAQRSSNVGLWDTTRETLQHPFGRQAIPMTWDYPEANPFSESTGGALGGVEWMKRVLLHESVSRIPALVHVGDAAALSIEGRSVDVVVTDPPYFDAIAYSDLSDFFYVWLKRALGELIPEVLITPLTPKGDEATALKHRHDGDAERADRHFTTKLAQVLAEAKRVTKPDGIITVMFAHQSTKAWTALVNALFEAGLTVDATWPVDTERKNRSIALGTSALESSITVTCRPRITGSTASFKQVRKEIEKVVQQSVKRFWSYGFRGADLIVACYGPAVGVFGKYERVEKADGTPVGIPELLELAKQAARDAIAGEFRGDNLSTLYYVWANLYGASEQSWDDARLVIQIGSSGEREIERLQNTEKPRGGSSNRSITQSPDQSIFVVDGSKCRLALLADRLPAGKAGAGRRGLGIDPNPPFIDALHRSMLFWKEEKRSDLVAYLAERDLLEDGPFWKLAQALFEVLPRDLEDWKLVNALLTERPTLRTEGKRTAFRDAQKELFD